MTKLVMRAPDVHEDPSVRGKRFDDFRRRHTVIV